MHSDREKLVEHLKVRLKLKYAANRILAPSEIDKDTVEACAQVASGAPAQTAGDRRRADAIAAAIRSLGSQP